VWRSLLSESIDRALDRHSYKLVAFVFMPEHVHLIVYPEAGASLIADVLNAIKRPFSQRIKRLLTEAKSPLLKRLTIQQRPGVTAFRFWQEGPGYDRNLIEERTTLAAIDYVHLNPVHRGLVQRATDWRWSSASAFESQQPGRDDDLPKLSGLSRGWCG
jgi:putative transposase